MGGQDIPGVVIASVRRRLGLVKTCNGSLYQVLLWEAKSPGFHYCSFDYSVHFVVAGANSSKYIY